MQGTLMDGMLRKCRTPGCDDLESSPAAHYCPTCLATRRRLKRLPKVAQRVLRSHLAQISHHLR